jgi:serine/threonine protein kinase
MLIELNKEFKLKEEEENNKSFNNSTLKTTEPGNKFSNFKLILPIAKGGYGTVGLYKKISTGDLYTIKSVDINKMKERKLSKTLQNERNIMKEISSDYVVTTYYLFKDKVKFYFVMEYLPGGDVYKLLSSIFLPFTTIQLIVAETLLAVNYLHSKNII